MFPYLLIPFLIISQPESLEQQLLYAERLFDTQDYQSSIVEYKRFLFYHPATDLTDVARYRIAQSHYYRGEFQHAQELFKTFTQTHVDSPLYLHAQLMLGKTYFDEEEYSTARSIFFQLLNSGGDKRLLIQAQYLRGWSYIHDKDWFKAVSEFRKVNQIQPDSTLADVSSQLADTTFAKTPLSLKSPELAQWLSTFVPGSGQIYAGKVRNGLISTAINAAFFYLLGDAVYDKRYVDAVGIYLVGWRFYVGNRSNAKRWAVEYNQKLESDFILELKNQTIRVEQDFYIPELGIIPF